MIQLRFEFQENPVADEVSAITAVVRPILQGLLYSLKKDVVEEAGGFDNAKLKMFPRLYSARAEMRLLAVGRFGF